MISFSDFLTEAKTKTSTFSKWVGICDADIRYMYDLHMADDEKIDVDRLTDMLEAFTKGKKGDNEDGEKYLFHVELSQFRGSRPEDKVKTEITSYVRDIMKESKPVVSMQTKQYDNPFDVYKVKTSSGEAYIGIYYVQIIGENYVKNFIEDLYFGNVGLMKDIIKLIDAPERISKEVLDMTRE